MNTDLLQGNNPGLRRLWPVLLAAFGLWLLAGCANPTPAETELPGRTDSSPASLDSIVTLTDAQLSALETSTPKPSTQPYTVRANGRVEVPPEGFAAVSLPFPGTIRNLHLLQGSPVQKGQVLCRVEDPGVIDLQQQYLEARAQLTFLEKDAVRQQQLADESIGAAKAAEKAASELELFRGRVAGLAAKLRLLQIDPDRLTPETLVSSYPLLSPISGLVTALHTATGKKLLAGEAVLELISTAHLHAEIYVYETDVPFVKAGQAVTLRLAQEPSQSYTGTVHLLNNSLETNRTLRVHVHFAREKPGWVVGSYLSASIVAQQTAWSVPHGAITQAGERSFVWAVAANRLVRVPVRVLQADTQQAFITWLTQPPDSLVIAANPGPLLGRR